MCSPKFGGMPEGVCMSGLGTGIFFRAFDALLHFRTPRQVLVQLLAVASVHLALHNPGVLHHEIQNRMLLLLAALEIRGRCAGGPAPKRRSKTSRGFGSGVTGCVGDRQDMLYP